MENVELGTEQKVMKSMTEDTVKGSLLHDPRYEGKKVQKRKQQEQQNQWHSTAKSSMELMVCY